MHWPASYAPSPTSRSSPAPCGADPSPRWQSAVSVSHASQLGGTVSSGLPGARPGAVWAARVRRIVDTKQTNIMASCRWLSPPGDEAHNGGGLRFRRSLGSADMFAADPDPSLDSLAGRAHLIDPCGPAPTGGRTFPRRFPRRYCVRLPTGHAPCRGCNFHPTATGPPVGLSSG